MNDYRLPISIVCLCALVANNALAAACGCRCLTKQRSDESCCHNLHIRATANSSRSHSCCGHSSNRNDRFIQPCECCGHTASNSAKATPGNERLSFSPISDSEFGSLTSFRTMVVELIQFENLSDKSSPPLRVLYCRWLE